ncbi:Fc.00g116450.m01.CDS01 [Cosmosporella sp. VM-42]
MPDQSYIPVLSHRVANLTQDSDQAPKEIRRSLELVQRCDRDLQRLVTARYKNFALLQHQAVELERLDGIIEATKKELGEACDIIETCRPGVHHGRLQVPLQRRMKWALYDAREFRSLEPLLNCQHASVLSELNHIRDLVLWSSSQSKTKSETTFDNVALLADLMGGRSVSSYKSTPAPPYTPIDPHPTFNAAIESPEGSTSAYSYPPSSLSSSLHNHKSSVVLGSEPHTADMLSKSISHPWLGGEGQRVVAGEFARQNIPSPISSRANTSSTDMDGLSLLFENYSTTHLSLPTPEIYNCHSQTSRFTEAPKRTSSIAPAQRLYELPG